METVPGALGVTTLALIVSEHRPLRPLTLNGVEATVGNGASGKYSHAKPYYLLTRADSSPAVKQFIAFMQSPAGRDILIRNGNWIP